LTVLAILSALTLLATLTLLAALALLTLLALLALLLATLAALALLTLLTGLAALAEATSHLLHLLAEALDFRQRPLHAVVLALAAAGAQGALGFPHALGQLVQTFRDGSLPEPGVGAETAANPLREGLHAEAELVLLHLAEGITHLRRGGALSGG
jgi:hypothetical protein